MTELYVCAYIDSDLSSVDSLPFSLIICDDWKRNGPHGCSAVLDNILHMRILCLKLWTRLYRFKDFC